MKNKILQSSEIRQKFIDYFARNGHTPQPSSRLIPEGDPTLLFTNAGMNQFKNLFLGLEKRPYTRAVTSQKCVRAGGKHNDLENVGFTARHHTFFEMLGNFSFGDYFKKEAIHYAWEFITKDLGLEKDRLYVSVFEKDDEAADIWHKQEGVPRERIYRFGEKDNFWRMGDTGPCGPCSEIFYNLDPAKYGEPDVKTLGNDNFIEFWNLVFMQYNEDGRGSAQPLPNPSIDTGMGLERLCSIMAGETSNYHTDLFMDLIQVAAKISRQEYVKQLPAGGMYSARQRDINVAMRVVADHARASAFLIADGVLPSNEGRGYVLRRIMRRGIRYARKLSESDSILPAVVSAVIKKMGPVYQELEQQRALIERSVQDEEKRFLSTLDQGTHILETELHKLQASGQKVLPGEVAFKLYDTYGFPLDLTHVMTNEKGCTVDDAGFEQKLQAAKQVARASWKGKGLSGDAAHLVEFSQRLKAQHGETVFTGYETTQLAASPLVGLSDGHKEVQELRADQTGVLIFKQTCFYAESGGQVGDQGVIRGPAGEAEVLDVTKQNGIHLHHIKVTDGVLKSDEPCQLVVQSTTRRNTANNHSATHLLHAALRKVLGSHVTQAGSLVDSEKLRFDFTHNQPMSPSEIEKVEELVNAEIAKSLPVQHTVTDPKTAMERGALALFGEKYGDQVRVIQMGDFSMELCGGTHVGNTAQIRFLKIVSESGVSAGVRRMEAITGDQAARYFLTLSREDLNARAKAGLTTGWQKILDGGAQEERVVVEWIESAQQKIRNLEREIQSLKGQGVDVDSLIGGAQAFDVSGQKGRFVFADIPMDDRKVLSDLSDKLQSKLQSAVVVLIGQGDGSHPLIVSVSKNLTSHLNAGKILGEVAQSLGGKGGGRPDFAQGAVPSRDNLAMAKEKAAGALRA